MGFARAKLQLAYLFTSSRKLAKHIYEQRKERERIFTSLKNDYRRPLEVAKQYRSEEQLVTLAELFLNEAKKFYEVAVFSQNDEAMLYFFRKYKSFAELRFEFKKIVKEINKKLPEEGKKIENIDVLFDKEEKEMELLSNEIKKLLRHEKLDVDRFADQLFVLREDATERKDVKELKFDANKIKHLNKEGHKILKHLKHDLKKEDRALMDDKRSTANAKIQARVLEPDIDAFYNALTQEIGLFNAIMKDILFVIKHSLHEYLVINALIEQFQEYYVSLAQNERLLSKQGLEKIEKLFKHIDKWRHQKSKTIFKITKRFKKKEID